MMATRRGNGFALNLGKYGLRAIGPTAVSVLLFILVALLLGVSREQQRHEHEALIYQHDLALCLVTLSDTEKAAIRQHLHENLVGLCPWIGETPWRKSVAGWWRRGWW